MLVVDPTIFEAQHTLGNGQGTGTCAERKKGQDLGLAQQAVMVILGGEACPWYFLIWFDCVLVL